MTATGATRFLHGTAGIIQSVEVLADGVQLAYLDNAQYFLAKHRQQLADETEFAEERVYESTEEIKDANVQANGFDPANAWTPPANDAAMKDYYKGVASRQITRERFKRAHIVSDKVPLRRVTLFKLSEILSQEHGAVNYPMFTLK